MLMHAIHQVPIINRCREDLLAFESACRKVLASRVQLPADLRRQMLELRRNNKRLFRVRMATPADVQGNKPRRLSLVVEPSPVLHQILADFRRQSQPNGAAE